MNLLGLHASIAVVVDITPIDDNARAYSIMNLIKMTRQSALSESPELSQLACAPVQTRKKAVPAHQGLA